MMRKMTKTVKLKKRLKIKYDNGNEDDIKG